mmetsp:Transcript_4142/g.12072  ORF Transcript_4142/g.12072 Transcript_4142/m.12072 type:complete len:468 (-) Transcript_4142:56-1459(-)
MADGAGLARLLGGAVHLRKRLSELRLGDDAGGVRVHGQEGRAQVPHHVRVEGVRRYHQPELPQPLGALVPPQRVHHLDAEARPPGQRRPLRRLLHHLLDEGRDERARGGPASVRVHLEQVVDELARLGGRAAVPGPGVARGAEVVHRGLLRRALEGRLPREHDEGDDADAPHVALLAVLPHEHLRRHGVDRPDLLVHALALHEPAAHAEVDELHLRVAFDRVEEDVLRLDVAVHDAARVAVDDGVEDLVDDARGLLLAELAPVEVPAPAELHDDVERVLLHVLVRRERPDDVRMVQRRQELHLRAQRLHGLAPLRSALQLEQERLAREELPRRLGLDLAHAHVIKPRHAQCAIGELVILAHVPPDVVRAHVLPERGALHISARPARAGHLLQGGLGGTAAAHLVACLCVCFLCSVVCVRASKPTRAHTTPCGIPPRRLLAAPPARARPFRPARSAAEHQRQKDENER